MIEQTYSHLKKTSKWARCDCIKEGTAKWEPIESDCFRWEILIRNMSREFRAFHVSLTVFKCFSTRGELRKVLQLALATCQGRSAVPSIDDS